MKFAPTKSPGFPAPLLAAALLAGCGLTSSGRDADANRGAIGLRPGAAGGQAPTPVFTSAADGAAGSNGEPGRDPDAQPASAADPSEPTPGDATPVPPPQTDDSPVSVETGEGGEQPGEQPQSGPCPALPEAMLHVEHAGEGSLSECAERTCQGVDLSGIDIDELYAMPAVPLAHYEGCTRIEGSLVVAKHAGELHELSCLEHVTGHVVIWDSPELISLGGLESLLEVDGDFELGMYQNLSTGTYDIADFGPLLNLQVIGGRFTFAGGPGAQTFPELPALRVVGRDVNFQFFYGASDIGSLNALEHVGGSFELWRPEGLEAITGLQSLTTIDGHYLVWGATTLVELDGPPKLSCIGDYVDIGGIESWENNAMLRRVNVFPALRTVGGVLMLEHNPMLEAFDMFGQAEAIDEMQITGNPKLASLALDHVTQSRGVIVRDNPLLSECSLREMGSRIGLEPGLLTLEGNLPCP